MPDPQPPTARERSGLLRSPWAVACAALLLLLGGARLALPTVLERVLEDQLGQALGREVAVDDVGLGLLAGHASIDGLRIGALRATGSDAPHAEVPDAEHALAALRRLDLDFAWLSLLRGEIRIESLRLAGLDARVLRDAQGRPVPIFVATAEEEEEPAADEEAGGMPFHLDALHVEDLSVLLLNLARHEHRPLEFRLESFTLEDLAVLGEELSVGSAGLEGPSLRVRRDLEVDDWLAVAAPAAPSAPAAVTAPAASAAVEEKVEAKPVPQPAKGGPPDLPRYHLREFVIERASFTLVSEELEIDAGLDLEARDLNTWEAFPVEASLVLSQGSVDLAGEFSASPPGFAGRVGWKDLPLAPLAHGAGPALPLEIRSGSSSGELQLRVRAGEAGAPARLHASGRVAVEGLDARDAEDLELTLAQLDLAVESILVTGSDEPPRIALSRLDLREPSIRVVRRAGAAAAEPEPVSEPAPGAPLVTLARLEVSGGVVEFVDESVSPRHRSRLRDVEVHGANLRWPGPGAGNLRAAGRGPGKGRFTLTGTSSDGRGDIDVLVADVGLAGFTGYSASAIGYGIEQGDATWKGKISLRPDRTRVNADLSMQDLDFASVEPGLFEKRFGMSLDIALALLRDPFGKVSLPISAEFGAGEGDVGMGRILVSALRQALVGSVTLPLKSAGFVWSKVTGDSGPLQLEPLKYAAGSAEPGEKAEHQLAAFAEVLDARPALGARIRGRAGKKDARRLAERILTEQVLADAELPPVDAGFFQRRRLRDALTERARGEPDPLEPDDAQALERWIESVPLDESSYAVLARERAAAARALLVRNHDIEEGRIELGEPLSGKPGVVVELVPLVR